MTTLNEFDIAENITAHIKALKGLAGLLDAVSLTNDTPSMEELAILIVILAESCEMDVDRLLDILHQRNQE
ncbi:hypothetical protein QJU96_09580 [Pasteurella skyensis]|uniref:Uncharacterized protein n=1 Tax=Phocoenobacter skyensis TaxID=97481 RepID=A0AAJ6NEM6_9PAST|nr:hypothetical protein [Pasteurella skyensis]MDP8171530.1 hypothetical protein [Pasteurella skyensis]MDP8175432.1 hypothetical protein [Pasteurella skyensis]